MLSVLALFTSCPLVASHAYVLPGESPGLASLALIGQNAAAREWALLETPSLCAVPPRAALPAPLLDASHLRSALADGDRETTATGAPLPNATFLQMLEDDARAHGTKLEIQRQTGAFLVRGDAAAVAAARALSTEIERGARVLDIDLQVDLAPASAPPAREASKTQHFARRVRSGDTLFLGRRDAQSYVAGFEVQVAADSGNSEPVVGHALTGAGLHVRAARVDGGKRVFVWGLFDASELGEIARFDPSTPDLGVVQEPRIETAQAAFSGTVESGGTLTVDLVGTSLSEPDWKISIRATASADPEPDASDAENAGFAILDLAFLAGETPAILPLEPGAALAHEAHFRAEDVPPPALPPSALAAMIETTREAGASSSSASGRTARAPMYWSDRLLFVPRGDPAALREARALVRGIESARLATGRVEIVRGTLRASLPVCVGHRGRLVAGSETARLVDYRLEVAPQIWMPVPIVEKTFDGLCVEIDSAARSAACSLWTAESAKPVEVQREDAQMGKLQLLARSLRAGAAVLRAGDPETIALESGTVGREVKLRLVGP